MAKGISLKVPGGALVRPTAVRARRALFDSLGDLGGGSVCDLFAGSGAVGFEFASRGAESVLFVEKSPQSLSALKSNLRKIEPLCSSCRFTVFSGTLPECAVRFSSLPAPDFIFADPPYAESSELLDGLLHEKSFTAWAERSLMIWELPEANFQLKVFPPESTSSPAATGPLKRSADKPFRITYNDREAAPTLRRGLLFYPAISKKNLLPSSSTYFS